jgi:hypothetical protein
MVNKRLTNGLACNIIPDILPIVDFFSPIHNQSGHDLTRLLEYIKEGTILTITSVDRLGRSLKDLIIVTALKAPSIIIQSLKERMYWYINWYVDV